MFTNNKKQKAAIVALLFSVSIAYAQVEIQKQSTFTSPADVWVKPKVSTSSRRGDKVVYAVRVPVKGGPQRQPFDLILRRPQAANQKAEAVYRVKPPMAEIVFDPKFSPQGDAVLLKVGWPFERYSPYRLFLYRFTGGSLVPGPQDDIVYRRTQVSTNGRYVAYVLGGDYSGRLSGSEEKLSLRIYDFQEKKSVAVAEGLGITNFTWRDSKTLLFQLFPAKVVSETEKAISTNKQQPVEAQRPTIMAFTVGDAAPRILLENAYGNLFFSSTLLPMRVSADGKWLAYYGWPDQPQSTGTNSSVYPHLMLYNITTQEKTVVGNYSSVGQQLLAWSPTNTLAATTTVYKKTGTEGIAHVSITLFNVSTRQLKKLKEIRLKDYKFIQRRDIDPIVEPIRFSIDGKRLILKACTALMPNPKLDKPMTSPVLNTLYELNIETGENKSIASTISRNASSIGLDWYG